MASGVSFLRFWGVEVLVREDQNLNPPPISLEGKLKG